VPELSRSQLVVYGAVAVVLLLVGARWIRSADAEGTSSGGVSVETRSGASGSGSSVSVTEGGEDVVVDVTGRVREPGVYRLPAGSRVNDALQRAGGAEGDADVEAINLAARLSDGQQISIPARAKGPVGVSLDSGTGGAMDPASAGPINFGSATPEELDTIDGIGPVTAQKLLEYRQQHGGISSVDDLDQIDGIGPATIEALRARLQP
jgi:competence protein ComEA